MAHPCVPEAGGASFVMSTLEFESAVEEEVPCGTADELVKNAGECEASGRQMDGNSLDRLDVAAFTWDGREWSPVAPRTGAPKP